MRVVCANKFSKIFRHRCGLPLCGVKHFLQRLGKTTLCVLICRTAYFCFVGCKRKHKMFDDYRKNSHLSAF